MTILAGMRHFLKNVTCRVKTLLSKETYASNFDVIRATQSDRRDQESKLNNTGQACLGIWGVRQITSFVTTRREL